jgi:hypothetical protein
MKCPVCGKEEMFHTCSEGTPMGMMGTVNDYKKKRGFFVSLRLAFDILRGSIRLLWLYPILIVPLFPVFLMVLAYEVFLLASSSYWAWAALFAVAYCLMFSFTIASNMLHQIHNGQNPEFWKAVGASTTRRMVTSVFFLTAIWFTLVLLLVAVETAVKTLLNRGGERLAGYVEDFFDTFAGALRMMGFMLIPIMVFEGVGLQDAYRRLKKTLRDSPISALTGLALTKMAWAFIFLVVVALAKFGESLGEITTGAIVLLGFPLLGIGWMFAMYLEQLFASGLYLYTTLPQSTVVNVLLRERIGRELPPVSVAQAAG